MRNNRPVGSQSGIGGVATLTGMPSGLLHPLFVPPLGLTSPWTSSRGGSGWSTDTIPFLILFLVSPPSSVPTDISHHYSWTWRPKSVFPQPMASFAIVTASGAGPTRFSSEAQPGTRRLLTIGRSPVPSTGLGRRSAVHAGPGPESGIPQVGPLVCGPVPHLKGGQSVGGEAQTPQVIKGPSYCPCGSCGSG